MCSRDQGFNLFLLSFLYRLKSLMSVTFSYPKELPPDVKNASDRRDAICPSCKKGFSNSTIMFCECSYFLRTCFNWIAILCAWTSREPIYVSIVLSKCSHVTCKTCADTFVRPSLQCVVCDKEAPIDSIIELRREGKQMNHLDITTFCVLKARLWCLLAQVLVMLAVG